MFVLFEIQSECSVGYDVAHSRFVLMWNGFKNANISFKAYWKYSSKQEKKVTLVIILIFMR